MAITIRDVREKYPQYDSISDDELADKLHSKYYPNLDKKDFYNRIGLQSEAKPEGWKGVAKDISQIPGALGKAIFPGIPNQIRGIASNPERLPGNVLQGIADLGQAPTAAMPALADYLASKGIISKETAAKTPLRPPNIENTFNKGHESGDILTQLLAGGVNVPGGVKAGTQAALKGTRALEKGLSKAAMPLKPSTYINSPLSREQLAANYRAAEGTQTPLGNIIDSPLLKGLFENVTSEVPFSGSDKITANIANQVKGKANKLFEASEAGLPPGERRGQLKTAIEAAYENQKKIKNELYMPVDEIAKAENFKVKLPSFSKTAKEFESLFEKSPLAQHDKEFSNTFNKFKNYKNPYIQNKSEILGPNGQPIAHEKIHPSIAEVKMFASRLEKEAANYNKSSTPSDRFLASKYEELAKSLRNDLKQNIEKNGSPELKSALSTADKNYAENFSQFLDSDVYKFTQDLDNMDNIINEIVKPGKSTDKYSRLEKIQNILPAEQKNIIGNEWLRRAIDKEGDLDPKQFARLIDSLGTKQFEALFPDAAYREQLLDYGRLRGMNEKSLSRMANPLTGQKAIKPAIIGSQITNAIGMGLTGHPLAVIASLVGPALGSKVLNQYLTSPAVRKNLIKKLMEKAES
jgi:hypothetical protein